MKSEMKIMDYRSLGLPDMSYHGSRAWYLDGNHLNRHFGVMYCGNYGRMDMTKEEEENIFVAYNMHWEEQSFGMPSPGKNKIWKKVISTALDIKEEPVKKEELVKEITVAPRSVEVYVSATEKKRK